MSRWDIENDDGWFRDERICPDGSLRPKVSDWTTSKAEANKLVDEFQEVYFEYGKNEKLWLFKFYH